MVPEATVTDGKVQSAVVFLAPILLYRAEGGSPSTPNYNGCVSASAMACIDLGC